MRGKVVGAVGLLVLAAAVTTGCAHDAARPPAGRPAAPPAAPAPPAVPGTAPSGSPPVEPTPAANATVVAATPAPSAALLTRLLADSVASGSFARRVLYTWTTSDQVDELRERRWLLTRTESPERGPALFDLRLQRIAKQDPVAALFARRALRYRRFAWTNPWATVMGWGEHEDYGLQLVQVTLKPEAVIGQLDARAPERWRFVDLNGQSVATRALLAHPERLAAIYHVWHGSGDPDHTSGNDRPFREHVLCNESMIERWELGSPAVVRRIEKDLQTMVLLAEQLRRGPSEPVPALGDWLARLDTTRWPGQGPSEQVLGAYEEALAFGADPYLPEAARIDSVAERLRQALAAPSLLVHEPSARYGDEPPKLAAPPPPPPRRRCERAWDTFCM